MCEIGPRPPRSAHGPKTAKTEKMATACGRSGGGSLPGAGVQAPGRAHQAARPTAHGSRTRQQRAGSHGHRPTAHGPGSDTRARAWWSIARGPRARFLYGQGPGAGGRRKAPAGTACRAWRMRYGGRYYAQVPRRKKTGRAGPVFGVIRRAAVRVTQRPGRPG